MTEPERRKMAADAARDLGVELRSAKTEIPFPTELEAGSVASLAARVAARDAYLQKLLNAKSLTPEQKRWVGSQLLEFHEQELQ